MLFAQNDKQPSHYEVVNVHVKPGLEDAFVAAVKAHDDKYHPGDGMLIPKRRQVLPLICLQKNPRLD